jgi:hypothetical protein
MRILRIILIAFSILFLLLTMALPFGVQFAFRGWYIDGGGAKIEEAKKQVDDQMAQLSKTLGGKVPAAMQKAIDDELAEKMKFVDVGKSMANFELGEAVLALALIITLFLPKRIIPIAVGSLLVVVAILGIVMVPDLKVGIGQTTRFEMQVMALVAIVGAVTGILASLIGAKKVATA